MHRKLIVLLVVVLASAAAVVLTVVATAHRPGRPVPNVPLVDARGNHVTLAAFRGKVVVLSPVLTLCHEVCPLTTGAFMTIQRAVRRAGLGSDVVFAEISVDPWRDSPARLRAFARRVRTDITLLTGTLSNLRRFWRFFGVGFVRTAEERPAALDWWTRRPETFDVAHSDGVFFIDRHGRLRAMLIGMPNVHGRLAPQLRALLDPRGRLDLAGPEVPWTVRQALAELSTLVGRSIPVQPD